MTTIHFCWSHLLIGLSTDVDISARIFILFNCPAQGSVRELFTQIHSEIKEEGSGAGEQLSSVSEFPRQFPSPGYSYYTRSQEYCVTQEAGDKDMETRYLSWLILTGEESSIIPICIFRSSLSSNSEGDETDLCRGYGRVSSYSGPGMMAASPYMVTRDTGQAHHGGHHDTGLASPGPGVKKDDKYWERRRWVNTGNIGEKI